MDVLVVRDGSTTGHRRSEGELLDALDQLGVRTATSSTDYGLLGRLPLSLNLLDVAHAAGNRWATTRALRSVEARAIIYATSSAALLEPSSRLRRGAVRFDALAAENRRGARHVLHRALERRRLGHARVLAPFGGPSTWPSQARTSGRPLVALPTPVERRFPACDERDATVVCYAGAPEKKGLDLLVAAWAMATKPKDHRLLVTGVDVRDGRRYLARKGIDEPPSVVWCGRLGEEDYRRLTSRAAVYLAASRFEDYGIAQLEALVDGALLVTVPSAGPFEALALARELDSRLVAQRSMARDLAAALGSAFALSDDERREYRLRASRLLEPYSRVAFRERLRHDLLPQLLDEPASTP